MRYRDRKDAASALIPFLVKYRGDDTILLAVPRGGIPIAYHISRRLGFPIELLMTKKIGHPHNPEFAIGAVGLEDSYVEEEYNTSQEYIESKIESIRKDLQERYKLLIGGRKPLDLHNKVLIIIDDGVATGNTIFSSIEMLRKQQPKKIVVAVPVAPPRAAQKFNKVVDEFICPYMPEGFVGVGYHYIDFSEVTDREAIRFLKDGDHKVTV